MQTPLVYPPYVTTVNKQVRRGVWDGPGQELHVYAEKGGSSEISILTRTEPSVRRFGLAVRR